MPSIAIANHPERNVIRAQLAQNIVLKEMLDGEREELEPHLLVVDCAKGESLLDQGVHEMEQYFVLDGVLKRVVTNANAKEMILRFANEHDIETSYAACRRQLAAAGLVVAVVGASARTVSAFALSIRSRAGFSTAIASTAATAFIAAAM